MQQFNQQFSVSGCLFRSDFFTSHNTQPTLVQSQSVYEYSKQRVSHADYNHEKKTQLHERVICCRKEIGIECNYRQVEMSEGQIEMLQGETQHTVRASETARGNDNSAFFLLPTIIDREVCTSMSAQCLAHISYVHDSKYADFPRLLLFTLFAARAKQRKFIVQSTELSLTLEHRRASRSELKVASDVSHMLRR